MDIGLGLCQPSTAILLVSAAGAIYHLLAGNMHAIVWWVLTGVIGTGVFQALCFGGLEPVAWVLMSIPVLIVCFFLAVALFASRMRIDNIMSVPCDNCGPPRPAPKPRCNKPRCQPCLLGQSQSQGLEGCAHETAE